MNVIHNKTMSCPPLWRGWDEAAGRFAPAFLWRNRGEAEVYLALGVARRFESLRDCREVLAGIRAHGDLAPRAFGVVAFDPREPLLPPWEEFPQMAFVLPEVLVRWRDGKAEAIGFDEKQLEEVIRMLQNPPLPVKPLVVDGRRAFSFDEWADGVKGIQTQMNAGAISKVVLARDSVRETSSPICAGFVLQELAATAKDCYLFACRFGKSTFVGATPERLFRTQGDVVETESLAGTRPRGRTAEEDENFAQELLHSAKESIEQNIVTQFELQELARLCVAVSDQLDPQVRKLANVQHLQTRLQGQLKDGISLDDILQALHPTPAVCGMPREEARELIAELEPTPRGLYAGAIGFVDAEQTEFAVAIRSALLKDRVAHLFAGAGIVQGSIARAEWRETALKMRPMLRALNCEEP